MFGNLITNRQLKKLRNENCLAIKPFDEDRLKRTHYTLSPGRILKRSEDGEWEIAHSFSEKKALFRLEPDEYVVVEVLQRIEITSDGIVGRFITASSNIEAGLFVMAGQIDSFYGINGETIRFGVKNLLSSENHISSDTRLAHIEFFDLRGITQDAVSQTQQEEQLWRSRKSDPKWERADSDGPSAAYDK